MRFYCRCRKCSARRVLPKHLDEYTRRPPRCRSCGEALRPDAWRNNQKKPRPCTCGGYHHNHRPGSRYCYYRANGEQREPGDPDYRDRWLDRELERDAMKTEAYVFDTETTGMEAPVRMVEHALLAVTLEEYFDNTDKAGPVQAWVEPEVGRWNPGKPIEFGAMATHFIEDHMVAQEAPCSSFVLPSDCGYLIGHNVDYDWEVIGKPDVKRICTLALSRMIWPQVSHKQLALVYMLNPVLARELGRDAHSAGADVQLCLFVLQEAVRYLGGVATWERLWELSEEARIPTIMPFGKHKGERINRLPQDYVKWLLKQSDVDPYLRQALEERP